MTPKIRSIQRAMVFLSLGLFLSGFVLTAFAQETQQTAPAAESTKKWMKKPSFSFKLGGFFPSVSMDIRVDPPGGGGPLPPGPQRGADHAGAGPALETRRISGRFSFRARANRS